MSFYDSAFYSDQEDGSRVSAKIVLSQLFERVGTPTSAIDIGCGVGTWAAELLEQGVSKVVGVDGDYVPRDRLYIPRDNFFACDLNLELLKFDKKFDFCICLEVAEHLNPERADSFIAEILNMSTSVLFSAAIPGQGGTHHINEQWQSYWVNKFNSQGFFAEFDIRSLVWESENVEFWYKQNMFFFSKKTLENRIDIIDVVHPEMFKYRCESYKKNICDLYRHRSRFARIFKFLR